MANDPIILKMPTVAFFPDGYLTGEDGAGNCVQPGAVRGFDPANHTFWQVPPIESTIAGGCPPVTDNPGKRLVYINGINTLRGGHAYTLKLISVVTGAKVVGIYNQSGNGADRTNMPGDLWQSLGDKLGFSNNPTTNTLEKAIFDACTTGIYLNVIAHSQGAIIASRGTRNAIKRLKDYYGRQDNEVRQVMERAEINHGIIDFLTRDRDERRRDQLMRERIMPIVERALNSYVTIQTFGGAASFYPDGPVYRHVFNYYDKVAQILGQGGLFHDGGRDSQTVRLRRDSGSPGPEWSADHSVDSVYMQPSETYVDLNNQHVDSNYIPIDMSIVR